jgi:predicted ester cyclase
VKEVVLCCVACRRKYRIEGGKIVEAWGYWDNLDLMQQLGAVLPMGE